MDLKNKSFVKKHPELVSFIIKLTCFALAVFITFGLILGITTMPSEYMEPNIKFHDFLIYSRITTDYFLQDVIIYEQDGETYVGRIVGTPGDKIEYKENGCLYLNGHLVYESQIFINTDYSVAREAELGENEYFVLTDNRQYLTDSRKFGPISSSQIKGTVLLDINRYHI